MNMEEMLQKGHSKAITAQLVRYVSNNPERFKQLVTIVLQDKDKLAQRAAWPLSYCVRNHPELLQPHFGLVFKILAKKGIHDGVKRNLLRMLQYVHIPRAHQAKAIERCFTLMDAQEAVAIQAFAMTVLAGIANEHPDLKQELKLTIIDRLPYSSAAFQSRGKRILRQLEK